MTYIPTTNSNPTIPSDFAISAKPFELVQPLQGSSKPTAVEPLPGFETSKVWGVEFSQLTMAQTLDFIDRLIHRRIPEYIITANLNYLMLCDESQRLAAFTRKAAVVLCDGMPILWRSKLNETRLPTRVAGADLIFSLAQRCAEKGHRLFLMGGAEGVAQQAAEKLVELYPKLKIAGVECPPFRQLSTFEHEALCSRIKKSKADVLLVAFGQPKGEFWIEENYQALGVAVSIQLGASFDFIVGTAYRAPMILQKTGLEWLYRMVHDPKRLLPRYARNAVFLLKAIRRDLLAATR
jgi:N-acetylglucosaminyldiphosphoundecaprenol N-acetyl-beta-D-mannosaminyltransferase